ncbi:MAG: SAM-dependent chlorinase/fluorinase [Candidatus Glassbacteria bacterium]|nr:SAM-dependent chlorinase/fluorinase [Candidatus Glassbacteria bacterium]
MSATTITLTTDFGTRDGYVGAMKGVIRSIAPEAVLEDITHRITPGRVAEAAFVLENFHACYPPGTVHLVVVDPGVGGPRRALAVRSGGRFYVGPDNGVFEAVFSADRQPACYELTNERYHRKPVSPTFHGRDIFAPAAAHLAAGLSPEELGPPAHDPLRLEGAACSARPGGLPLTGHVVHIDRFGNLVTDLRLRDLEAVSADKSRIRVSCCGVEIDGVSEFYAQANRGKFLALIGSSGRLEVALREGSAAAKLGEPAHDAVVTITKSTR